jgi:carbonic anhydrase
MHRRTALALLQVPAVAAAPWVYANSGETSANAAAQEETWGGLCVAGHEQSPINVVTSSAVKTAMPVIETNFDATPDYIKNSGHGFQVFETDPELHGHNEEHEAISKGVTKGHSTIGGSKYNFYQVHWHSPSENTVDGKSFPLEAHFVHQLDDASLHGTFHRLAVIGLLYELGTDDECNVFLDKFWNTFPDDKGSAMYSGDDLDFNAKLSEELKHGYYHWYGSLTTPPCTEGVSWNLLKKTEKVCQRQVDKLQEALAKTQDGIGFNNRVTMPLNHRVVSEMAPDATRRPANNIAPFEEQGKWYYAEKGQTEANAATQEETWKGLCASGHEQSPIDVVTSEVKTTSTAVISTHYDAMANYVKNTGHGYQVFETSPKEHELKNEVLAVIDESRSAKGHAMIGGSKYNFYQVHWHAPSENTVDGKSFAMEAHFVHQLDDPSLHGTLHRLAVVGLLYELGTDDECNEFLDKFWAAFPENKGNGLYTGDDFDLNAKLSEELKHGYYHWYGSLTTPPCTEGVSWNLLKRTEKVCPAQVMKLKAALNQTQDGVPFNNRVTQPLNHRVVTLTCPQEVEASSTVGQGSIVGLLSLLLAALPLSLF